MPHLWHRGTWSLLCATQMLLSNLSWRRHTSWRRPNLLRPQWLHLATDTQWCCCPTGDGLLADQANDDLVLLTIIRILCSSRHSIDMRIHSHVEIELVLHVTLGRGVVRIMLRLAGIELGFRHVWRFTTQHSLVHVVYQSILGVLLAV